MAALRRVLLGALLLAAALANSGASARSLLQQGVGAGDDAPPPPPPPPPAGDEAPQAVNASDAAIQASRAKYAPVIDAISTFLETTKPTATSNKTNFWAPRIIRLAWHSSGTWDPAAKVGGSNGATMRFLPESNHSENPGLDVSRAQLEGIKEQFPWISYGDLWTLAGCVAVKNMQGPSMWWRPGRTDAKDNSTCPPDGNLPDASKDAGHVRDVFTRLGFGDKETVALLGAHSVGGCHQNLSNYKGAWSLTPQVLDNTYFKNLLEQKWSIKVKDGRKPWTGKLQFDSPDLGLDERGLPQHVMMLPTDMALRNDTKFRVWVEAYAKNLTLFHEVFADAFRKVLENGVPFTEEDIAFQV